jgi:predicted transporter
MDLDILLWMGGMLFSLSIFAVKVGLGLSYGKVKRKGIYIALGGHIALFVGVALLSQTLMRILEPLLRKGPYLHICIATGMIAWGVVTIARLGHESRRSPQTGCCNSSPVPSLFLILPCPVCIAAMTFSTWSALNAVKLPAALVGLGLGFAFTAMTLVVVAFAGLGRSEHPETTLGLTMITVGLYFIASLYLPAKIAEAKGMYTSLATEGNAVSTYHGMAIGAILLALVVIGFFAGKPREAKQ